MLLTVGLLILFSTVMAYVAGGRHDRFVRWLGGGLLFSGGLLMLSGLAGSFHPIMLTSLIVYPLSLSVGYGATEVGDKLRHRLHFGWWVGAASGTVLLPLGLWGCWGFQIGLAMAASAFYGVTNPTSAVGEEGVISLLMLGTVPFLIIR